MNILKASAALAIGLFALNATAANDIANFNRYADDNRRIMELPESESRVVFMGNSISGPPTAPNSSRSTILSVEASRHRLHMI